MGRVEHSLGGLVDRATVRLADAATAGELRAAAEELATQLTDWLLQPLASRALDAQQAARVQELRCVVKGLVGLAILREIRAGAEAAGRAAGRQGLSVASPNPN